MCASGGVYEVIQDLVCVSLKSLWHEKIIIFKVYCMGVENKTPCRKSMQQ